MDKKVKELCQEYIECIKVGLDTMLEKIIIPAFHKEDDSEIQDAIKKIRFECDRLKALMEYTDITEELFDLIQEVGFIQAKAIYKK
jgi:endonuclease III